MAMGAELKEEKDFNKIFPNSLENGINQKNFFYTNVIFRV